MGEIKIIRYMDGPYPAESDGDARKTWSVKDSCWSKGKHVHIIRRSLSRLHQSTSAPTGRHDRNPHNVQYVHSTVIVPGNIKNIPFPLKKEKKQNLHVDGGFIHIQVTDKTCLLFQVQSFQVIINISQAWPVISSDPYQSWDITYFHL